MIPAPAPGIYRNVPMDEYQAWDAASSHRLMDVLKSPKLCRYNIDHPQPSSPALELGSAIHAIVLEPDKFKTDYITAEQCEAITKEKKQCSKTGAALIGGTWYCGIHAKMEKTDSDKKILSRDEYKTYVDIKNSIDAHPLASQLVSNIIDTELSFVWCCGSVVCKGRADALAFEDSVLDLKSTIDASPDAFSRSIYNFGYYIQAAFYKDGLAACGTPKDNYFILAAEKEPPYQPALYLLSEREPAVRDDNGEVILKERAGALELGRIQYMKALAIYSRCISTDEWPGYNNDQLAEIGLPAWAASKILSNR
jgi:hypothetical protein